ncbi:MAG: hypothetical protein IJN03_00065 [Bacilli bacterium]|nr:hypothetical protein [Bacilli bacterium]
MKKYFFIFILFLAMILTVSAKNIDRNLDVNNLNSRDLLGYLKEIKQNPKSIKVCNKDYCDYLKYNSLEKSVNTYIDEYISFVKNKSDEETSIKVLLQGFLITEIIY